MASGGRQGSMRSGPALLGIYLNDHLAGATAAVELARRAAAAREDLQEREPLERFAAESAADRAGLREMMGALGVPVRHHKMYAGWLAEKAGRLKLNGHLVGRSPLSSVEEAEVLLLGVEGKVAAWRTLRALAEHDDRLDRHRLDQLIASADRQTYVLEELRLRAVSMVLALMPGVPQASGGKAGPGGQRGAPAARWRAWIPRHSRAAGQVKARGR